MRAYLNQGLAHQIRAMRNSREWSQKMLSDKMDCKAQSIISRLEDPAYGKYTIQTLTKVADAFDVALMVRFVPFSKLIDDAEDLSPRALNVTSFEEDMHAHEGATEIAASMTNDFFDRLTFPRIAEMEPEYIALDDVSSSYQANSFNFEITNVSDQALST